MNLKSKIKMITKPQVKLVNAFSNPIETMASAARTCYSSKGLVEISEVGESEKKYTNALRILKSIFQAGHHTVIQHLNFQFAISNVSRQFVWSFLHSHPYYNSEQVSQRYVQVKKENVFIPPLSENLLSIYTDCVSFQMDSYYKLIEMLKEIVSCEYYKRFPKRKGEPKYEKEIERKSQEVARYVLPLGTLTYLYHTINAITLIRYWKLVNLPDTPYEQRLVVEEMVKQVVALDSNLAMFFNHSYSFDETLENKALKSCANLWEGNGNVKNSFKKEFDQDMEGLHSKLISYNKDAEDIIHQAVCQVLGINLSTISKQQAIDLLITPQVNPYLADTVELFTISKLTKTLYNAHYVFKKRLSHCADSQNQRHRTTPSAKPILTFLDHTQPDFITPKLIKEDTKVLKFYTEVMEKVWEFYNKFLKEGGSKEFALYLLPNALTIRFTETADFLNLLHKLKSRLCLNAQEEIWQASLEEAIQIQKVHPNLGKYLLAPCFYRKNANITPFCPEGERYCGIPLWKYTLHQYSRVI
jgi:flavin-dependent thymidylate synthase